jgi:hypothetical protein
LRHYFLGENNELIIDPGRLPVDRELSDPALTLVVLDVLFHHWVPGPLRVFSFFGEPLWLLGVVSAEVGGCLRVPHHPVGSP